MQGPTRMFWDYREADWRSVRRHVHKHINRDMLHRLTPEAAVAHVYSVICRGMQLYIPHEVRTIRVSSVPWFDEECYTHVCLPHGAGCHQGQHNG